MPIPNTSTQPTDIWNPKAYEQSASYVPQLAGKLQQWLNPRATDCILDVGCGDGKLTAVFGQAAQHVVGIDASPMMIEAAQRDFGGPKAEFHVVDCQHLEQYVEQDPRVIAGGYDKVVSNSALHWILRDESTRMSTLRGVLAALRPGGSFAFEMGGHGHVHEVFTAIMYTLVHHGVPMDRAKAINRWFFPSEAYMTRSLEKAGFIVEKTEVEYRPTKLTTAEGGGLAGWVKLFGAPMIQALPVEKQEPAVSQICEVLEPVVTRIEDGSQWLAYVRLRGIAHKQP